MESVVISPYIQPLELRRAVYTSDLERLLDEGTPTFVLSAARVLARSRTTDVYGLDLAVEAFLRVADELPTSRLALFVALPPRSPRARAYLGNLLRRLEGVLPRERYAIVHGEALSGVFGHDVVLIRPSRTDGDAVSIREALEAGRPVIASDAVVRPEGTTLVPSGNADELADAMRRIASVEAETRAGSAAGNLSDDNATAVLQLYARLLAAAREACPPDGSGPY